MRPIPTPSKASLPEPEGYRPTGYLEGNSELREALEMIDAGTFSRGNRELFRPLTDNLRHADPFLLRGLQRHAACHERVNAAWQDQERWARMSILNTARGGKFSSDRAICEYSERIWHAKPVKISPG